MAIKQDGSRAYLVGFLVLACAFAGTGCATMYDRSPLDPAASKEQHEGLWDDFLKALAQLVVADGRSVGGGGAVSLPSGAAPRQ